jgi:hypothetical protein
MTKIFLTNGFLRRTTMDIEVVHNLINNTKDDYIKIDNGSLSRPCKILINKNTISTIEDD